jgi:transcription antitermination factor NusG
MVRATSGPFQNFVGVFESEHASHRVSALFNLFGRQVVVSFKQGDLVAA